MIIQMNVLKHVQLRLYMCRQLIYDYSDECAETCTAEIVYYVQTVDLRTGHMAIDRKNGSKSFSGTIGVPVILKLLHCYIWLALKLY